MKLLPSRKKTMYEPVLFGALIFINIFILFYFHFFPNWDGPAHVGSAAVAATYNDSAKSAFREYFYVSSTPSPNLVGHFALVLLQKIVSPILAEKILVLLIFVLFPLCFRYLILSLNPDARHMSYYALPFSIGWFVYAGQYNFSISIIVFFTAIGYWVLHHGSMRLKQTVVLCLLLIILYISHIVSFLMFYLFVFTLMIYHVVYEYFVDKVDLKDGVRFLVRDSIPVVLASLPSAFMAIIYFSQSERGDVNYRLSIAELIKEFGTLNSVLLVFDRKEYLFSVLVSLSVVILLLIVVANNTSAIWKKTFNGYAVTFLVILGLYFVLPDALAGGSFFSRRLCLFAYIALILWLAHFQFHVMIKRILILILAVSMIGLTVVRFPKLIDFNKDIEEFMSVEPILKSNTTVLTLSYTYDGYYIPESQHAGVTAFAKNVRPMDFLAGYLMAERGVVDLGNYEGAYKYFPVQYQANVNPFAYLGGGSDWMEFLPPDVDISRYANQTPGNVDYVLVWGIDQASDEFLSDSRTILVQSQLQENYELIFTSEPRGLLHVYKRLE